MLLKMGIANTTKLLNWGGLIGNTNITFFNAILLKQRTINLFCTAYILYSFYKNKYYFDLIML